MYPTRAFLAEFMLLKIDLHKLALFSKINSHKILSEAFSIIREKCVP